MRDVTARLHGKAEAVRGDLPPADKHLRRGQPIERVVQLHGREAGSVVGELFPLFELGGIENSSPPVAVNVSRGADPHLAPTGHVPIYRCSRTGSGVKLRALSLRGPTAGVRHVTAPKPEG